MGEDGETDRSSSTYPRRQHVEAVQQVKAVDQDDTGGHGER
jgi:hypothetical protein